MRKTWLVVVLLVSLAASGTCWGAAYVLSDFETDPDLGQWEGTDGAGLSRVALHPTHGSYSCLMDLPVTTYPGMSLSSFPTNDWSAYDVLRMDLHNPLGYALVLHIEISDSVQGSSWPKRYYTEEAIIPGPNQVEINLHTMLRVDESGYVDTAHINRFLFYVTGFGSPVLMYLDYVRLDNIEDDPDADAARGIWKFDVGDGNSRWTDFFSLAAGTIYPLSPTRPFGWVDPNYHYSGDFGGPDDLVRDWVRPLPCCPNDADTSLDFRLDVPNGTYHVYTIARSGDLSEMPILPYKIYAEGQLKVNVPMDSATFYSTDYFYRGMNEDYPLSASAWEMFEQANFPAYTFTTTVSDGKLDLRFVHAWVYAIIVYPDTPEMVAEMTTRIADLTAARRTQFESNYYINQPDSLTFPPTAEESARGYAAWPASLMDACYPDTLPPSPRPALALSTFATQGEYRPVSLAIRPINGISDVSVDVTDLSDGLGHTIAGAEIEKEQLRYMATGDTEFFGAGVLSWKPRLLQRNFPISVEAQVTKQLSLTVHVPDGTPAGVYGGTVTVHASSGDVAVPLTVQVYGFPLDPANDQAYGWYYNPPESQYDIDTRFFPDLAGRADELLRVDLSLMKQHGFNSLQFPSPSVTANSSGHITSLATAECERYVTAMGEVGFGGNWLGQVGTLRIAGDIMDAGHAEFSPLFNQAFKEALAAMVAWGETPAGAPLAFYLVDEPRETGIQPWNRNFADSMQYCDLANQVPGAVSTITVMADADGSVDYTPFADALDIMQTHPWPNSDGLIAGAFDQGKPNWFYNTGGDLRMVYGFYQYRYGGGGGAWEWHYDWLDGDMFDTFPYSPFNNHWRYVYPSPDGPVPTLNFELASLGITDYRYASTLRRLAWQARASGVPELIAWADQADALLQAINDDTPTFAIDNAYRSIHFANIPEAPGCRAQAEAAMDDYRHQIAALIAASPMPIPGSQAQVVSSSLPTNMEWEGAADASVTIRNLDTVTWTAGDGYQLLSTGGLDRWGLISRPLVSDVSPGGTCLFDFTVTAPPLSTISYPTPVTDLTPGVTDDLACGWSMSHGADPLSGGTASEDVVVSRFFDIQPGTTGEWARFYVEELAGRVPAIIGGFGGGVYAPSLPVDRASMAVFIARAIGLELEDYQGLFPTDVPGPGPDPQWAWPWIEAMARAGLVGGPGGGRYGPEAAVDRDAMAVFVARGMVGSADVPAGPEVGHFVDVPDADPGPAQWAYDEIEYCYANSVVGGFDATHYSPGPGGRGNPVDRASMAVFVYRGFIQPTGTAVVLGGPAITAVDPETAGYWGWSSSVSGPASDPGYAYVVFDAVRMGTNLAGPDSFFDVLFELSGPTTVSHTVHVPEADVAAAKGEAMATGVAYYAVRWDIPSDLPAGDYTLRVSAEDGTGTMQEVARQPAFTITP